MKYQLNVKRDVDGPAGDYLLWLPHGYRFSDEVVHVRGYDTIAEIRKAAKEDVVVCEIGFDQETVYGAEPEA